MPCGDEDCDCQNIEGWQPISSAAELASMKNGGSYYLTTDIELETNVTISSSKTINLNLNGKNISMAGTETKRIFIVNGGTLNIYDCTNSGVIGGSESSIHDNGAIYINNGGTVTMYGGVIAYNKAETKGGAVYVNNGTFTMYGGVIENNSAPTCGGAVYVNSGSFDYVDGDVRGNYSNGETSNICGCSYSETAHRHFLEMDIIHTLELAR